MIDLFAFAPSYEESRQFGLYFKIGLIVWFVVALLIWRFVKINSDKPNLRLLALLARIATTAFVSLFIVFALAAVVKLFGAMF